MSQFDSGNAKNDFDYYRIIILFVSMEFKILLYIVGAAIYIVYRQYQKLQKEALKRKASLEQSMPAERMVQDQSAVKPVTKPTEVKSKSVRPFASARQALKPKSPSPQPFFETPEHYKPVFDVSKEQSELLPKAAISTDSEHYNQEQIDIRKLILYSELLKRPAW